MHWIPGKILSTADLSLGGKDNKITHRSDGVFCTRYTCFGQPSGLKPRACDKGARGKNSKLVFPSPGNMPTIKVTGEGGGKADLKKQLHNRHAQGS